MRFIICDPKWHLKYPRNFWPPPWRLQNIFIFCWHSAYVYICYSILKAKTYNWLPNTHTHTHAPATTTNKRQLGTVDRLLMVIWLAQTLLSCAKFWLLRVLKKGDDFADTGLAVETPAGSAPAKACFKLLHWFGKRHKMDAFTKLGNLLTVLDQHFWCLFCFFYQCLVIFPTVLLYPQQSVPTLCYTRRHLPSAVPWISKDCLLFPEITY